MKPLTHTGDSANIAFYAEEAPRLGDIQIWAEILRDDFEHRKGQPMRKREKPRFYITVYRRLQGEITRTRYIPRKPVPPGPLDDATATRLVRQALKGA